MKGNVNIGMTPVDDEDVKPFTPVPANPIRVADFLRYVASHQDALGKYKDEFQVRRQFVTENQRTY